ncbi:MAG: NADH-quinone oxidoreductase subunit L [Candidatus Omnitrophica bacterium]|nr:NADH-quinone oxidoreductase subunit L [Candidatus Omnitrophota bacterium]MDD5552320.1 NADH-quinone oxidoreductase subunit L [Candidatus Omnitrophota bacterium]
MNPALGAISLPILGAFIIKAFPKKHKPGLSVLTLFATFILCLFAVPPVIKFKEIIFQKYFTDWFSLSFVIDGLSVFMAGVSSFVALLIGLYSLEYMKEYADKDEFYFWTLIFVGAMMGLVFSSNLILIYCFWEVTAVCSWKLIGFYRKEKDAKAADRAFLVTFFGASLMLLGIVLIYLAYGTLELSNLKTQAIGNLFAFLLLGGIISKSAQLPLHTWLPDAGVAPTPVTALLHAAVLVKIGVYVFARLFYLTFIPTPVFLNSVIALCAITIVVAGGAALVESNMKRILAYSTVSQLGYIILAFSLGTDLAFKMAMLYILAHSLAKAGLFLCAGIVEHKTGTKDINELGGLLKTMPYTGTAYLLCAFAIIGIPPFLGFWPKFMTVLFTVQQGHLWAGILAIAGALFTLFYLMRLFDRVFLGEVKIKAAEESRSLMVTVVLALGISSLLLGLGIKFPLNFLQAVVR